MRDQVLQEALDSGEHDVCLERLPDGALSLKKTHPYWYQVQAQLNITEKKFADFVIWTEKNLHIEKINQDVVFFNIKLEKLQQLCKTAILPELLAKWHTKPKDDDLVQKNLFCYCRVLHEDSLVLVCGNSACTFQKFLLKCCGLKRMPNCKNKPWFCKDCKKLIKSSASNS